jgi:hypothetical protein
LHQGLVTTVTLGMNVQQFFDVRIAFPAVTTHAQTFEQFAARTHAIVNGTFYLGVRYRFANAYVHLTFPKKLKVMLMITILIKKARVTSNYFWVFCHKNGKNWVIPVWCLVAKIQVILLYDIIIGRIKAKAPLLAIFQLRYPAVLQ